MKNVSFSNPPITEALLDIRTKKDNSLDIASLEKSYDELKTRFPEKQIKTHFEAGMKVVKNELSGMHFDTQPIGLLYKAADNSEVVQLRNDGFTYNKLKPYNGWESFISSAKNLWETYKKYADPKICTRIGLRYINLIEIPMPISNFKEYFLTVPEIAEGIPQGLAEMFMRVAIPDTNTENVAIITENIDKKKLSPTCFPLIFDVDVYQEVSLSIDNEQALWKIVEEQREFKNKIFLETFTDKAKALFN